MSEGSVTHPTALLTMACEQSATGQQLCLLVVQSQLAHLARELSMQIQLIWIPKQLATTLKACSTAPTKC